MIGTSVFLLPALAGLSLAATTSVIWIIMPEVEQRTIEASVISVGPTATSYFLACPTGEDSLDCGLGAGIRLLEGPSTMEWHMTVPEDQSTYDALCAVNSQNTICTFHVDENGLSTSGVETMTDYFSHKIPVTITAGLELLDSGSGSPTNGAGSTITSAPSTLVTASGGSSPSGTGAGTGTTKSGAAGVPRATQNAVLFGVAAAVGGALMI